MAKLKRTYQAGYYGPAKRMRMANTSTLTKRAILNKPEVKDLVISLATLSQVNNSIETTPIFNFITPGVGQGNRVGTRIRVLSIEVSGRPFGDVNNGTFELVCPNDANDAPDLIDFGSAVGGYYDTTNGWSMLHCIRDGANLQVLQSWRKTFPLGMLVSYSPPNEINPEGIVNKNQVYACVVNRTGVSLTNISYSIRIRFTDA